MKQCTVCKETKSFENFYNYRTTADGKSYRCKVCDGLARKKYHEENKEAAHLSQRKRNLKFRFGISLEEYDSILEEQGGGCALCGSSDSRGDYSLPVDHDHKTGEIRGILCNNCNRGLGLLGDTKEKIGKALDYLKRRHTDD